MRPISNASAWRTFQLMLIALAIIGIVYSQCSNPLIRQEWRQMSNSQKSIFLSAIQTLKNNPQGTEPPTWNYNQFADCHWDYQVNNHDKPAFFVWHREFIHYFEQALQRIDSSITLPYWDWTLDSQNPVASNLLTPSYFGLNGDPVTNCMVEGVAAGWNGASNSNGCLKRCNTFGTLFPPEGVNGLISAATSYEMLQKAIENGPHGAVHMQLGGSCGDFSKMSSTNDPVISIN